VNLQMASEQDPQRLLRGVCAQSRRLLGARFAVLAVAEKQQLGDLMAFSSGLPGDPVEGISHPREDHGVFGKVFAERSSWRVASPDGTPLQLGLPAAFPAVRSALAVPVCSLTRSHGWLCVGDKLGADEFTAEDERMLTILGAQLGRIYENGSLYRDVQEQATELMVEIEERARATEQLRSSEERFRELAEKIHDVFFVARPDLLQTTYVSPGYERIWGRPVAFMLNRAGSWMETVHPEDRERIEQEIGQIRSHFPAEGQMEYRILLPDATLRWILTRFFPVLDDLGNIIRVVGVSKDITEPKVAALRIMRLNRTHSVLSGINSLIVRASNRDALLQDACNLAVEKGGFPVAWCGLVDAPAGELCATACAGSEAAWPASLRVRLDAHHASASLVVDAVMSAEPRVCNDLDRNDRPILHRQHMLDKGYRSLAALPLVIAGQGIGCFVLLSDHADYFDEEEMHLLVELAEDISFALDHIGKAERLSYLASFDPLTGLANRRAFEERLGRYVGMAAHSAASFAVIVADPERFEVLNNTLGRAAGDQLLRQAAARFTEAAGGPEVAGHIGSDQFAAIITGPVDTAAMGRMIEELWSSWLGAPFEVNGHAIELSARAGVALYPDDARSADALLANAAAALRDAKETGKTISFYTRHLSERFAERLALQTSLRRALEYNEYELHYQPKVDLAQRRVLGLEALLRWRRPEHGLVAPARFVPMLEETGMIVEVGAWVMRQACADRARWLAQGFTAPRVAVNVSPVQLRRDDFVGVVGEVLREAGAAAGLDIEVTETLLMADVTDNLAKLAAIRDLGVSIALDDFGTGYSSLAYLARLPVDTLKIDRSFVASMLDDQSTTTLVSTIISMARSLKLETVAEGVESEEQAKILRLLGCDQIQGYLVSKPLPFDEMTAFLESRRGNG
jgi:diguanylate cyclase (GGDEF)-like protein/PAS domain S-box-containing protein